MEYPRTPPPSAHHMSALDWGYNIANAKHGDDQPKDKMRKGRPFVVSLRRNVEDCIPMIFLVASVVCVDLNQGQ